MNWLRAIIAGIFDSLFGWGQAQAEKPKPITHAETPPAKLEQFQNDIEAFKKRKDEEYNRNNPVP